MSMQSKSLLEHETFKRREEGEVHFMSGNEACAEGAMAAGLSFYAGYPITPSTEIMEILSYRLPQAGKLFIQMEDELASMAAIIGASLGGARAMTATSGPGFSLMQENLGFACITEVPCVVVNVQRLGPSTGQPTSPSQGDVMQARWGTHGDHPIIALCPASVQETFDLTVWSFNLAERFRTPVILLMDEVVAHMRERVVVPPLASFGEGYRFHLTGLLHDVSGFPTFRSDELIPWFKRVFRKIDHHLDEVVFYREEGLGDAEYLIIAYGCTARSALAAQREARRQGIKVGLLQLQTIWPFPEDLVRMTSRGMKGIIVPELNLGQLVLEVERAVRGACPVMGVHRVDGRQIQPQSILDAMEVTKL